MKTVGKFFITALHAGHGRALPSLLLFFAAWILAFSDSTPLSGLRNALFDRYQQSMPRTRTSEPVVVVGIDSQSLNHDGQWPWPRDRVAELTRRILAGRPLALGLDFLFIEPDRYSPERLQQRVPGLSAQQIGALPDPDLELATALASGPTVLALAGLNHLLPGTRAAAKPLPRIEASPPALAMLADFSAALPSRPVLEQAAAGEGFINSGMDGVYSDTERGVIRHLPALARIGGLPFLPLSLEMVRQALGPETPVHLEDGIGEVKAIRIGDYRLPLQNKGDLLLHFGTANANYYLSADDVLAGRHLPEVFRDRFVIIGLNSTGLQDSILTPLGQRLPGVDVHVQVIESLLSGHALKRPRWMPHLEMGALLIAGLILIVVLPRLRPRLAVAAHALLSISLLGIGVLAFHSGLWLFDGATLSLLLTPVFVSLLGHSLFEADAGRCQAEADLHLSREAAARTAGELDAARRIQLGLLPDPSRLFAGEKRFSVAAMLEPAQAVGGDFYDCFLLDEHRLCLAIGDVSGKGVPASLFMATSKVLTGALARRQHDLGLAMQEVEYELNRENPEYLFVTAFVAIIDVDRGHMTYVCAGHDAPLLLRNEEVIKIDTATCSGPPLCAAGAFPFAESSLQLYPGDRLCLYTDGVTEAANGQAFFGKQRLTTALLAGRALAIDAMRDHLYQEVRDFEAGHPPADDLTLLILDYYGPAASITSA